MAALTPADSVLLIGNFLSGANASRCVCEELAPRLADAGWSVSGASSVRNRPGRLLDMLWTACRRRRAFRVAEVEVYSGPAFLWAEAVCRVLRRLGRPYVLALHGGNLPGFARKSPARVARLLRSAAAVTAPSRYLAEQMASYREDISVLPNAIDLRAYEYVPRMRATPRLIWLRALHPIYNPRMAVEVAARLRSSYPGLALKMAGPEKAPGAVAMLRALAERLGVAVELAGKVPKAEVGRWLNQGDIFLNTAGTDNTPVSVIEAMACGLCVVSTDAGGLPYLLQHGHDALLAPCDDAAAMASAVRRVLESPSLARRLSANARAKAEQFDWSVIRPRWEALLRSVSGEIRRG